jgi:hypothetical protein
MERKAQFGGKFNNMISITKILDEGFQLYKRCFVYILPLVLTDAILAVLINILIPLQAETPEALLNIIQENAAYFILYMVIIFILYSAIFYRMNAIYNQSDINNLTALQEGLRKGLAIILAAMIYFFLVFIGLMIIIPGVILLVSLALFTPLIIVENASPFEGLQRSHQMIWKNWWAVASILSISLLIVMSASMLSGSIIQIIFTNSLSEEQLIQLMQFVSLTVDKFVSPFFYAVLLLLYYELKGEVKPKNQEGFIA